MNEYALVGEKWYQLENYYNSLGHDDSDLGQCDDN